MQPGSKAKIQTSLGSCYSNHLWITQKCPTINSWFTWERFTNHSQIPQKCLSNHSMRSLVECLFELLGNTLDAFLESFCESLRSVSQITLWFTWKHFLNNPWNTLGMCSWITHELLGSLFWITSESLESNFASVLYLIFSDFFKKNWSFQSLVIR